VKIRPLALVIESDTDRAGRIEAGLHAGGWQVTRADGAQAAAETLANLKPDVLLVSGLSTDITLRADVPLVRVLARGRLGQEDRFELELRDGSRELVWVRQLAERLYAWLRPPVARSTAGVIESGGLRVDTSACRVLLHGRELTLTMTEHRVLVTLLCAQGRDVSRAELWREAWGVRRTLGSRAIDAHVARLRRKLGGFGATIQSVRGTGYRFVATAGRFDRITD